MCKVYWRCFPGRPPARNFEVKFWDFWKPELFIKHILDFVRGCLRSWRLRSLTNLLSLQRQLQLQVYSFNTVRLIWQTQSFHLLNNRRAKIIHARLRDAQNPTKSQVNWKNTSMHTQARYISHISNWQKRPFACDKCDKTYIKSFHLARHKETHSPQKPHRCSYPGCTVSCTTRQHLKTHESLHTEPTPYQVTPLPSNLTLVCRISPLRFIVSQETSPTLTYFRNTYSCSCLSLSSCRRRLSICLQQSI